MTCQLKRYVVIHEKHMWNCLCFESSKPGICLSEPCKPWNELNPFKKQVDVNDKKGNRQKLPEDQGPFTHKTEGPWPLQSKSSHALVQRADTVQVHFTHQGEGLKAQRRLHEWKVYMESYMADYGYGCMVYRNFFNIFFQHDRFQGRFQNIFQDRF